jgi:hypothetical protein
MESHKRTVPLQKRKKKRKEISKQKKEEEKKPNFRDIPRHIYQLQFTIEKPCWLVCCITIDKPKTLLSFSV